MTLRVRRRRRRLVIWTGVFLALVLLALVGLVLRAVEEIASAARSAVVPLVRSNVTASRRIGDPTGADPARP